MDQAVTKLLSMGAVYLALATVIITFFIRRIVETALPSAKKSPPQTTFARWWQSVILYGLPVVTGALLSVGEATAGFSVVEGGNTLGGQIIFGMIVGWFSGFLYKVFRKTLKKKTGIDPVPGPPSVMGSDPPKDSDTADDIPTKKPEDSDPPAEDTKDEKLKDEKPKADKDD